MHQLCALLWGERLPFEVFNDVYELTFKVSHHFVDGLNLLRTANEDGISFLGSAFDQ